MSQPQLQQERLTASDDDRGLITGLIINRCSTKVSRKFDPVPALHVFIIFLPFLETLTACDNLVRASLAISVYPTQPIQNHGSKEMGFLR
jgi:hypothetical protein